MNFEGFIMSMYFIAMLVMSVIIAYHSPLHW